MNLKEHQEIVERYNKGKEDLLKQVQDRIGEIGNKKAIELTGKRKTYIADLKAGRKYIAYETLIDLAKILF